MKLEFQAIVLAGGRGTRLPELVSDRPKCLLPVGPFPMIFYPLSLLQRHGFHEIIVIVLESQRTEIQQAIERLPIKSRIEYATIPSDNDYGTADALRHIQDKIKCDVVVISCDTVTNISLVPMLNQFRQYNAAIVSQLFKSGIEADAIVPGPKTKHKQDRDLIGVQKSTQRLTFLASTSDFEENIRLPYHLLHRYGDMTMHSRLIDSHIYVINKWIIKFLNRNDTFSTLKGELIPHIVKKQMSRPATHNDNEKATSIMNVNMKLDDVFQFVPQEELAKRITDASLFNDSANRNPFNNDLIRCYALHSPEDSFGLRVNTTLAFCAINQKIISLWEKLFEKSTALPLISSQSNIKSTQMTYCAVADHATLSEKTSLKNCVFGVNCTVNQKTRVSNSVLMNGVIIEEGCVIENCIIGYRSTIRSNSVLKNCLIGPNYEVAEGTTQEKMHLTNADGFMEIE